MMLARLLATAVLTLCASLPAAAQVPAYPTGTVRLVVPFAAGSMTDILSRALAEKLTATWGQQVLVENKPGLPGTASVAKATPDGATLIVTSNGLTVLKAINKDLSFDPIADFAPITKIAVIPLVMVAPPDSPAKSLKELVAAVKEKPGQMTYSAVGLGSATGIASVQFLEQAGLKMNMLSHKGTPDLHTAIVRGDASWGFTFYNVAGDLIQSGKMKALVVTGAERLPQLKDVPTFAEAGFPQIKYDAWFGMAAPAGTPPAIIAKVNKDVVAALADKALIQRFSAQAVKLVTSTPEAFAQTIKEDATLFAPLFPAK